MYISDLMYRIPTFATTNIQYTTYHVVVIILIRPSVSRSLLFLSAL